MPLREVMKKRKKKVKEPRDLTWARLHADPKLRAWFDKQQERNRSEIDNSTPYKTQRADTSGIDTQLQPRPLTETLRSDGLVVSLRLPAQGTLVVQLMTPSGP
jgi:hypothetical protein